MIRRFGMLVAAAAMGMLVAATSAQAAGPPVTTVAWSPTNTSSSPTNTSSGTYALNAGAGATKAVTFTLTNSGVRSTGTLAPVALTNTKGTAFSITSDGCSGLALGPTTSRSCDVTVEYAPTTSGESDSATLTGTGGEHANAISITLIGTSGTPELTLSALTGPAPTLTVPPGSYDFGTRNYLYDVGQVNTATVTRTFTVTNSTGTSNTLQLAGLLPNTGFTLSNDQTSGFVLPPGWSSTFELSFSPSCTGPQMFATPLGVNAQDNGSPYISVLATAHCAPNPKVTAALDNLTSSYTGNPEFVAIGSGPSASIGVSGTLRNVSVSPILGFTIQIPYSITAKDTYDLTGVGTGQVVPATLNCDASRSYAVQAGIGFVGGGGSGTCSVSNNVLTVSGSLPASWPYTLWTRGYHSDIVYAAVGSSLPSGVACCAYVTWGKPTVTAAH